PAPVTAPATAPVRVAAISSPAPAFSQTSRPVANPLSAPSGRWGVQLGAFGVPGNADRLWGQLAGNPALAGTSKALVPSGRVTRLQAVGFASRGDAQAACTRLKAQGQDCIVAKPRG
ncbi:MAG: SPOR domain-containing protein, partial [Pseudomonadota bacterium]